MSQARPKRKRCQSKFPSSPNAYSKQKRYTWTFQSLGHKPPGGNVGQPSPSRAVCSEEMLHVPKEAKTRVLSFLIQKVGWSSGPPGNWGAMLV